MKNGQTFGQWLKWDFEKNGDLDIRNKDNELIYTERSNQSWAKWELGSENETVYFEDSDGNIIDIRHKPSPELTLESLAEQVFRLAEIVEKLTNKS